VRQSSRPLPLLKSSFGSVGVLINGTAVLTRKRA
jgi:hypothetical protein